MSDPEDDVVEAPQGLSVSVTNGGENLSLDGGHVTYNNGPEDDQPPLDWGDKYLWPVDPRAKDGE